jgi:uncharacterized protein (TIGR04255 family)
LVDLSKNDKTEDCDSDRSSLFNRIDLPGVGIDLKDYFRTSPEISQDLPQMLHNFFMQLKFSFPSCEADCLLNQTVVPPPNEKMSSIVLDIDLFRTKSLLQDENGLWANIELLRNGKNSIFEACITDATRRLFQ